MISLRDQSTRLDAQNLQLGKQTAELSQLGDQLARKNAELSDLRTEAIAVASQTKRARESFDAVTSDLDLARAEAGQLALRLAEMERQRVSEEVKLADARQRVVQVDGELQQRTLERDQAKEDASRWAKQRDEILDLGIAGATVDEFRAAAVRVVEEDYLAHVKHVCQTKQDLWKDPHNTWMLRRLGRDVVCTMTFEDFDRENSRVLADAARPLAEYEERYPWIRERTRQRRAEIEAQYPARYPLPSYVLMP